MYFIFKGEIDGDLKYELDEINRINAELANLETALLKIKSVSDAFFYEFVHFFKKSRHFLTSKVYMSLFKQNKSVLFIKISKKTFLLFSTLGYY